MWRFGRVQVKFGKPMDFSRFEGLAGNRFIERAVIDEVMYELMRLSGQEYVDLYAADVKEGKRRRRPSRPRACPRQPPAESARRHGSCGAGTRGVDPGPAARRTTVPATTITASAHHTYEPPASWRHSDAAVSWCSGISVIGVHTISAMPATVTTASATCRCR